MVEFRNYYVAYRRLGFSCLEAFRFAWIVATGARPIPIRATVRRPLRQRF